MHGRREKSLVQPHRERGEDGFAVARRVAGQRFAHMLDGRRGSPGGGPASSHGARHNRPAPRARPCPARRPCDRIASIFLAIAIGASRGMRASSSAIRSPIIGAGGVERIGSGHGVSLLLTLAASPKMVNVESKGGQRWSFAESASMSPAHNWFAVAVDLGDRRRRRVPRHPGQQLERGAGRGASKREAIARD